MKLEDSDIFKNDEDQEINLAATLVELSQI